ncbi:hypothetical protein Tco_1393466 [Tanacetum coccineum]
MESDGSDQDARYALSKLLQMGTVAEYESEFVVLANRVMRISESLLTSFYISGLKLTLQIDLLRARPKTLGEAFALARITEPFEDGEATIVIAKSNDLNIAVQVQDIEETTLHTSNKVEAVSTSMVATYEKHGWQDGFCMVATYEEQECQDGLKPVTTRSSARWKRVEPVYVQNRVSVNEISSLKEGKYVRSGCTTALDVVPWETDGESVLRESCSTRASPPTAKNLWESLERKYRQKKAGTNVKFVVARFYDDKMVDSKSVANMVEQWVIFTQVLIFQGEGIRKTKKKNDKKGKGKSLYCCNLQDAEAGGESKSANMVDENVEMIAMVSDVAVDNGQKLFMCTLQMLIHGWKEMLFEVDIEKVKLT